MTGRFKFGKMSIGMRRTARTLPSATATTATITVSGRLMAKSIGFMGSLPRHLRGPSPRRITPVASDRRRGRVVVEHFRDELPDLQLRRLECRHALGRGAVIPPRLAADDLGVRAQVAGLFELVEERV